LIKKFKFRRNFSYNYNDELQTSDSIQSLWFGEVQESIPTLCLTYNTSFVFTFYDISVQVCLISDPRPGNRYGKLYTLDMLNNMAGGRKVLYNNQPIEVLIKAAQESIVNRGEPVWYGCQVSKRFSDKLGLEDLKM